MLETRGGTNRKSQTLVRSRTTSSANRRGGRHRGAWGPSKQDSPLHAVGVECAVGVGPYVLMRRVPERGLGGSRSGLTSRRAWIAKQHGTDDGGDHTGSSDDPARSSAALALLLAQGLATWRAVLGSPHSVLGTCTLTVLCRAASTAGAEHDRSPTSKGTRVQAIPPRTMSRPTNTATHCVRSTPPAASHAQLDVEPHKAADRSRGCRTGCLWGVKCDMNDREPSTWC